MTSDDVIYYRARLAAWVEAHEALEVRLRERDVCVCAATEGESSCVTLRHGRFNWHNAAHHA